MKDLYTFDKSIPLALSTYHEVREMYSQLFDELKIPYLVAEADSGDMGGDLSHEFHFPTSKGEDHIINCESCNYVSNEEKAISPPVQPLDDQDLSTTSIKKWYGISRDRSTLITVWYPSAKDAETSGPSPEVNFRAVKAVFPDLDGSVDNAEAIFWARHAPKSGAKSPSDTVSNQQARIVNFVDGRFSQKLRKKLDLLDSIPLSDESITKSWGSTAPPVTTLYHNPVNYEPMNLLRIQTGDACPRCDKGKVIVQEAIELGHTFHLGSRYTKPLEANVLLPSELTRGNEDAFEFVTEGQNSNGRKVMMQMGCHGIGVSRMIGAVADTLADEKGLNWPRVMAPFEAVIVPARGLDDAAVEVYDALSQPQALGQAPLDLALDDRKQSFPWKMQDADLVGYPVIVVIGKRWAEERICEVQCRRLKVREDIAFEKLPMFINSLLNQL
jgi:prolyl-tRNA synthetase